MGRAQRRRLEKAIKGQEKSELENMIVLSKEELSQIKTDVAKFDVEVLMTCFAKVLRDKYGWGYIRITRVLSAVDETFGKILDDELDLKTLQKSLADEVGLKVFS